MRTRDEIGDLAAAFNRVQARPRCCCERQVASRRNVAAMFAGVGRRTSNLVGRQLALIDTLERSEEDPDTLRDALPARPRVDPPAPQRQQPRSCCPARRRARARAGRSPLPDADPCARSGSVEDFQRVNLTGGAGPCTWRPARSSDLVLLLAELIENAVLFSPPQVPVEVVRVGHRGRLRAR